MKYKLISTDFDDTLLNDKKRVSEFTKETLYKYKEAGYIIVGVTARPLTAVTTILDINIFDYLILNNGSNIYDVKNNTFTNLNNISLDTLLKINSKYEDICKNMAFITSDVYYTLRYLNDLPFNVILDKGLEEITVERINIMLDSTFSLDDEVAYINNNFDDIYAIIMQDSKSPLRWLTVSPKGVNKFNSLKLLGEKLNIEIDNMIFFGDGPNDLEIIGNVGLGISMKNALDIVKKASKEETEFTNDEDGVAKYLIKNIKI